MTFRAEGGRASPPGRPLGAGERAGGGRTEGQAAVELALVLPLVALLLLFLVQVGLVVRDQILVVHAAREAARQVAVDPSPASAAAAARASSGLDPARLEIVVSGRGEPGSRARVTAKYSAPTAVPLVGRLVGDLHLEATATMRVER